MAKGISTRRMLSPNKQRKNAIFCKKSILIHDYAKKGKLTEELLRQIITGEKTKAARSGSPKPIKIKETVINRFFGREQSRKEIEDTIVKALEFYFAQSSENPEQKVG